MKCLKNDISIPAWISCRTYFFGQENSRTYISNDKRHSYILLEGLASDMWQLLIEGDEDTFEEWIYKKNLPDQVEPFLNDLAQEGLIVFDKIKNYGVEQPQYEPMSSVNSDNEAKFVEEMQNWLYNNKFMYSLFVELTYRCNLKCVHCYNPKDMRGELDFGLCKKAIDDAYDLGCFRITFSGGEATLHSRFTELVKYAKSKRMTVEIFTNGQLLAADENLYREILALYPYRICISLYSTEKQMHERVTAVDGSFKRTYGLIHRLRKDNVNVQIKNFLLNFNCMDCIKVKKMAEGICATSVADISLIPTIEGNKKTMQYQLSEDELFKLYTAPQSPLYVGTDFKKFDYEKIKNSSPCLGGLTGVCINPEGKVTICVSMPLCVGNIGERSLKDIWQSAMAKDPTSELYRWQQVRIADCDECYKNDYCQFCSYCPGMGYLENGYLKHSDVLCRQAKVKMKAYNYLIGLNQN